MVSTHLYPKIQADPFLIGKGR